MIQNSPNPSTQGTNAPSTNQAGRLKNLLIALAAIALTVAFTLGVQTQNSSATLTVMATESTPLEVALNNNKPTLLEFYANWCASCQAMAGDLQELKEEYNDKINFVMLNVDNTKWLPEILKYRVDGIPHFIFMANNNQEIAQAIGEIPSNIMSANLTALIDGNSLPYADSTGKVSNFKPPVTPTQNSSRDPRSHSSQLIIDN